MKPLTIKSGVLTLLSLILAFTTYPQKPPTTDNLDSPPRQNSVYYTTSPVDMNDGIEVGTLSIDGADVLIQKLVTDIGNNVYGPLASILVWHRGKLVFEMYANYGYENVPHFLMSVTKTITSLLLSRAIELDYLTIADLQKPVIDFFPDIDRTNIQPGTDEITLYDALMMQSGLRGLKEWMSGDDLEGYKLIQKYFELTTTPLDKEYKYAANDCNIVMAVVAELVTKQPDFKYSTVWEFIEQEFLGKLGITNYKWDKAPNGYPSTAAGCHLRSRDLLKMGIAVHHKGVYNGEQLFSREYIDRLFDMALRKQNRPHMNRPIGFIYFTEGFEHSINGIDFTAVGGRGAAGQYITSYQELDLVIAATSDNRAGTGFGMEHARRAHLDNLVPLFANKDIFRFPEEYHGLNKKNKK